MHEKTLRNPHPAFTLIELLAVVSIIALVAGLLVPAFTHISQSSNLTNAANELANELNYAQQLAVRDNVPTQILFYSFIKSENGDSTAHLQAYQIWSQVPNQALSTRKGFRSVSKVMNMPAGICISDSSTYSTILGNSSATTAVSYVSDLKVPGSTDEAWSPLTIGASASDHTYFEITFYPDGSTDLGDPATGSNVGAWCLTVYPVNGKPAGNAGGANLGPSANFITLVVDSLNGTVRAIRPG